jgi:hypothetical protein
VIEPFINYVMDRCAFIEPNELRMANGPVVEAQPIESNICAFSASLCLGKVLSATLATYSTLVAIHGEGVDIPSMGFSAALCEQMDGITTTTAMYEANRVQAAHALNKLSAEYMVKEKAKEKAQKANAATGKKRPIPVDDSSDSSEPPPSDDDDEDDD